MPPVPPLLERAELYLTQPPAQPLPAAAALHAALAHAGLRAADVECVNLLVNPERARRAGVSVTPCWRLAGAGGYSVVAGFAEDIDAEAVRAAFARGAAARPLAGPT